MQAVRERILILCKTYPSPSAKYTETSCVAGVTSAGRLIRLYPVPFRLIPDDSQFHKWQWITAMVQRSPADRRRESHRVMVDTIELEGQPIGTEHAWRQRRALLTPLPVFTDFAAVEEARQRDGATLALLRPSRLLDLRIRPAERPDWTDDEREKLLHMQTQLGLFDAPERSALRQLRKVPFEFHYEYECDTPEGARRYWHKIVDWEAGALYWNVRRAHGADWEAPFRNRLFDAMAKSELHLLLGTIHRFPDQWLIVSLIYPPRLRPEDSGQPSLPLS